jgi:hypothetical protein
LKFQTCGENSNRRPPDADLPTADFQLAGGVQHILVNGEAMLDFPRPLTASVSYMGSVLEPIARSSAGGVVKSPLSDEWMTILDRPGSKGTILVSFGTVLRGATIPMYILVEHVHFLIISTQDNIVRNLAVFTDYTVVWRMDVEVESAKLYPHVHLSKWLPQKELLCKLFERRGNFGGSVDSRTRLFVTHAGYNSLLECAQAGVPMVFVPLVIG